MTVRTALRLREDEAAQLLHALIARAAADLDIRVLAIKGPVAALQGLRAPRTSADVDVLVHPRDIRALVDGLVALGWRKWGAVNSAPFIMPRHSVNLLNDLWPVGIDVHHYFPGFLADPGDVFDALWDRQEQVTLAGVPIPACDPVGHSAVVALHLLRSFPDGEGSALADLEDRARLVLRPGDVEALVGLARRTDATATLRPFLLALGVPQSDLGEARDPEAFALWNRRARVVGSAPWIMLLAQTPKRHWPRIVWHAVMLTEKEILEMHQVVPEAGVTRLRLHRIRRGVKGMPRSVRSVMAARRRASRW